jgi:maltooligosyltrehalose trehalohydrolase
MDALRLDAVDTIYDFGSRHILAQISEAVHQRARELGRQVFLIAESDLNDVRVINPIERGGYAIDAQWNDDFHHSLHALITKERKGYYQDFGSITDLHTSLRDGFVYAGRYSRYRKRKHGNSSKSISARRLVVCAQNHDQIGNRMQGERLSSLATFEQQKLAAACVIFSPFLPLLFMGEEYGEQAPFQYFVHHVDEELVKSVREGRSAEFSHFEWNGQVPDPQSENTFLRSKLNPDLQHSGRHAILFNYYKMLLSLRKSLPAIASLDKDRMAVDCHEKEQALVIRGWHDESHILMVLSFHDRETSLAVHMPPGLWKKVLDSSSPEWGGSDERAGQLLRSSDGEVSVQMNPRSAVLYVLCREEI